MKVFLAGPIDYWWNENYHTPAHYRYLLWKEQMARCLIEAGHLVYRPDQAWKGAWEEGAQVVNDRALEICDVFVYLTPPGVPAYGTEAERDAARRHGLQVLHAPPGNKEQVKSLLVPLDDPYGMVYRKSYTNKN